MGPPRTPPQGAIDAPISRSKLLTLWTGSAGLLFSMLNALLRLLTQQIDPFQTQFLRYLAGCLVLLPFVLRAGVAAYRPQNIGGQFARGAPRRVQSPPRSTGADTTRASAPARQTASSGSSWRLLQTWVSPRRMAKPP